MAEIVKKIKIKQQDNTYSDYIPLGTDAKNVSTNNGKDLQVTLGDMNIDNDGSIAERLNNLENILEKMTTFATLESINEIKE